MSPPDATQRSSQTVLQKEKNYVRQKDRQETERERLPFGIQLHQLKCSLLWSCIWDLEEGEGREGNFVGKGNRMWGKKAKI